MKAYYFKLIITVFCVIPSCFTGSSYHNGLDCKRIDVLYRQRIPNSAMVLYRYEYYGDWAFSDATYGSFLLDSTVKLDLATSVKKLPNGRITNIEANRIDAIRFISPGESNPKDTYTEKYGDMDFVVKQYYNKTGSSMNFFYKFHNLTETGDSIFFDKITPTIFGRELPDKVGFRKGNITVEEDSLGYITKINFSIMNQYPLWEQMRSSGGNIDLTKYVFSGEDLISLPPLSLVYIFNFELTPDSISMQQKISDYGGI